MKRTREVRLIRTPRLSHYIAKIEDRKVSWISLSFVYNTLLSSFDGTLCVIIEKDRPKAWILNVHTSKTLTILTLPDGIRVEDLCLSFDNSRLVSRKEASEMYEYRCKECARILLSSLQSPFTNRRQLSIWIIPDVFTDAVECAEYNMTREKALWIIGQELSKTEYLGDAFKRYCCQY
jgi:hypothetical protein